MSSHNLPILPPLSNQMHNSSSQQRPQEHHHRSKYDHTLDPKKEIAKVVRLNNNYGFLYSYTRNEELFFHFSEILQTASGAQLIVGNDVEYEYGYSDGGRAAALRVKVVDLNRMRKIGRVDKVAKGNNPGVIKLDDGLIVKYYDCICGRNDVVEVSLSSSGKKLLCQDVVVLESYEEKLLENSPWEQGRIISLKEDYGFIQSTSRREHVYFRYSHVKEEVKIDKCVEFKVVMEENSSPAARLISFLPDDSIQFRTVMQNDVRGIILTLPHETRGKKKKSQPGSISLHTPLSINDKTLSTVLFYIQDTSLPIPWLKQGDELVFDIANDHFDDSYCIQSVKLSELSLVGRTEGVITVLKEGFGFISLAERQADVYFRLENLLPKSIQKELVEIVDVAVGTEVSFDLSLKSQRSNEKENLRAHRILPLPKGSITTEKSLAECIKGTITNLHQDGGYIELQEPIQGMSFEEHHPLITTMLNNFIASDKQEIFYSDIQSPHENRFIIALAEAKGLTVSFVNDTIEDTTLLRLKITKEENKKKKMKAVKPVKLVRFDKKYYDAVVGDVITCDVIQYRRTQTYAAINVTFVERPKSKKKQHNCIGLVLMEPAHSNISKHHHKNTTNGKWDTTENHSNATISMNDGYILLVECKDEPDKVLQHIIYHNENHRQEYHHPKRGEFVSFTLKSNKVKDMKLVKKNGISKVIGTLSDINEEDHTAVFHDKSNQSIISTHEILGCDIATLNSKTQMEAIVYQNNLYGICRTSDLYLTSKITTPSKQRQRLNLTVKKELGGKVVAQSCMAKGPDGGRGFVKGWTGRCSRYEDV